MGRPASTLAKIGGALLLLAGIASADPKVTLPPALVELDRALEPLRAMPADEARTRKACDHRAELRERLNKAFALPAPRGAPYDDSDWMGVARLLSAKLEGVTLRCGEPDLGDATRRLASFLDEYQRVLETLRPKALTAELAAFQTRWQKVAPGPGNKASPKLACAQVKKLAAAGTAIPAEGPVGNAAAWKDARAALGTALDGLGPACKSHRDDDIDARLSEANAAFNALVVLLPDAR
jgi:hypothetical protein